MSSEAPRRSRPAKPNLIGHYDCLIIGGGHVGAQASISLRQNRFTGSIGISVVNLICRTSAHRFPRTTCSAPIDNEIRLRPLHSGWSANGRTARAFSRWVATLSDPFGSPTQHHPPYRPKRSRSNLDPGRLGDRLDSFGDGFPHSRQAMVGQRTTRFRLSAARSQQAGATDRVDAGGHRGVSLQLHRSRRRDQEAHAPTRVKQSAGLTMV